VDQATQFEQKFLAMLARLETRSLEFRKTRMADYPPPCLLKCLPFNCASDPSADHQNAGVFLPTVIAIRDVRADGLDHLPGPQPFIILAASLTHKANAIARRAAEFADPRKLGNPNAGRLLGCDAF
jgi:hypothetical protein